MHSLFLLLWLSPFKWKWAVGKVLLVKALLMHPEDKICRLVKRGRLLYKNVVVFLGLFIYWCKGKINRFYSILLSTGKDDFLANYVWLSVCMLSRYSQNATKLSLENFQMCQKNPPQTQDNQHFLWISDKSELLSLEPYKANYSFLSSWIFYFNSFLVCVLKSESDRQTRGKVLCQGRGDLVQM